MVPRLSKQFFTNSQVSCGQDRYTVDKSTKLCTAIAYCSTMNIRLGVPNANMPLKRSKQDLIIVNFTC